MKKIISLLMVACMMIGMLTIMPISIGAAGTITIASVDDWMTKLSGKDVGEANINVTATELDFTGKDVKPAFKFKGTFNGNGVVIKNVNMNTANDSDNECGLFYCLDGAATFENFVIKSSTFEGKKWVGTIACCICGDTTVKNVYVHNDVTVKSGGGAVGGLIGGCTGSSNITVTFTDCVVAATVDGGTDKYVGGLLGNGQTKSETQAKTFVLTNCMMLGSVTTTSTDASGFIGYNVKSDQYGSITATNCIYAGRGFISYPFGNAGSFTATNCYTTHVNDDKRLYKSAGVAVTTDDQNTGVTVIDETALKGTNATVTVDGYTKRTDDIMVPTGVAAIAPALYSQTFTVKWMNGETALATETYKYGEMPSYKGTTPTKAEDDTFTYEFEMWTPEIVTASDDATYEAVFRKILKNTDGVYNLWDGTTATEFAGGTGTEADPYLIANGAQLALMRDKVNNGTANTAYFRLTDNITLNASIEAPSNTWTPIGVGNAFKGSFDGNGKTISGLYIKYNGADGTGFFAMVNDATIKNFAIVDSHIESTGTTNDCGETGGLAAFVKDSEKGTIIDSVYIHATVRGYYQNVGGFVGLLSGSSTKALTIKNCVFAGRVNAVHIRVGGFVGNGNGAPVQIYNCLNAGDVTSETSNNAAGLIGNHGGEEKWVIKNCITIGKIKVATASGGLRHFVTGKSGITSNTIADCYYIEGLLENNGSTEVSAYQGAPANIESVQKKALEFFMGDTKITWSDWTERNGDIIIPTGVAAFAPALFASKYTVTWVNEDGTVLATEEYDGGAMPEYKGETPTKASDDTYDYTFSTWTPVLAVVTADTTYKAEFYKTRKNISIGGEATDTKASETNAPVTNAPDTQAPEEKGGCSSIIGGGAVALVAVIGSAVVIGKNRKED